MKEDQTDEVSIHFLIPPKEGEGSRLVYADLPDEVIKAAENDTRLSDAFCLDMRIK